MPSFDFLDKVELFVRGGTFPDDSSKTSKKVTRAASKHFLFKDGCLWRSYRGRLLRVVRSQEEVRDILVRYHDNNNHAGRVRTIRQIMLMYYWVGVTEAVKAWIKACAVCQSRGSAEPPEPPVQFCLAYGCDASSFVCPELSFHRFPKEAARREQWLAVAQRDEGSLRSKSCLCSRHFEPSCFTLSWDGQTILSPDAVPTVVSVTVQDNQAPVPPDEDFLPSGSLEDLLSSAAAAESSDPSEPPFGRPDVPAALQEHQYCLPPPDPASADLQPPLEEKRRKTVIEPTFTAYNQIARFLSHRVLPMQSKQTRGALRRMAKRFGLIDGVLMYTRVSPPLRVPRSREEVNSILQQFHDNQGHYGQGICQREILKHFYWASMARDLARWISSCHTCLNRTKRQWLRCSISNCTNCCGPVERGLGLTFHTFPLDSQALLAQWLKAVGRPNWHPRLRSSVCSTHFTEDCFDRSGDKVTIHPDAVPTLLVHRESVTGSRDQTQPAVGEEAYFAKYDAVELYLSRRTYPPRLSYVEKNTFRRFCKKFTIKDGELHIVVADRERLVLRSRRRVEAALQDYHNELNHLDGSKCLRLLNERYFWKTMRSDVVQWINSCSQCSMKKKKKKKKPERQEEPGRRESLLEGLRSPRIPEEADSGRDDEDDSDEDVDDGGMVDEDGGSVGDEDQQPAADSEQRQEEVLPLQPVAPVSSQPRIPILLHLRTPISLQPRTPIILQPRTPNAPFVARLWPAKRPSEVQKETSRSDPQQTKPLDPVRVQDLTRPPSEPDPPPDVAPRPLSLQSPPPRSLGGVQRPLKRRRDRQEAPAARRGSSSGLDPVVAPSTKPWPVFTIAGAPPPQSAKPPPKSNRSAPCRRPRSLQARTVIQQCSRAKVKTKPAHDGADAQWAEIQEGMIVYVCFFHGATEEVTQDMASSLMTTKLFRKDTGHTVSVLDLPGSVLFVPQDSLLGQPASQRRMQYRGGCEPWWGAQLYSNLVSACREFMSGSAKCTKAGVKVEQGLYGQRQEVELNSAEPLTLLMEF